MPFSGLTTDQIKINGNSSNQFIQDNITYKSEVSSDEDGNAQINFSLVGADISVLTGLSQAIERGDASYDLTANEKIKYWGINNGSHISPTLGSQMDINFNGNELDGQNNLGFFVEVDKTLNLSDIGNIYGFDNYKWESQFLHNEGTTSITSTNGASIIANNNSENNTLIYNTGVLNIGAESSSTQIGVSGDITGANGYINLLSDFSLDVGNISGNHITVNNGAKFYLSRETTLDLSGYNLTLMNESYLSLGGGNSFTLGYNRENTRDTTISANNNIIDRIEAENLIFTGGNVNLNLDVDFTSLVKMDQLIGNNLTVNEETAININSLNIINDMEKGYFTVKAKPVTDNIANNDGLSLSVSGIPDYINTDNYRYSVSFDTDLNEFTFTKFGALTGLAAAIASSANTSETYVFTNGDEKIDAWGINADNTANNGIVNNDTIIDASNNRLVGVNNITTNARVNGITINNHTVSLSNALNVTNFDNAFNLDNGRLDLKIATISGNNIGVYSSSNSTITLNNTEITDNTNADIYNDGTLDIYQKSGSEIGVIDGNGDGLLVFRDNDPNSVVGTIKNNDVTINASSSLNIDNLLDLSNHELLVKTEGLVNQHSPSNSKLVLNNSSIKLLNNSIDDIHFNTLEFSNTNTLDLDVDLLNAQIDTITYDNELDLSNEGSEFSINRINVTNGMDTDTKHVNLSPITGLNIDQLKLNPTSITYGNIIYSLNVVEDDENSASILFSLKGATSGLTGLADAINSRVSSYDLSADESITYWGENGSFVDPIESSEMVINGDNHEIIGNGNYGLYVKADKELSLNNISKISGFDSYLWEGGAIHNEGTTNINAFTTDTSIVGNVSLNDDSFNGIYNNGILNFNGGLANKIIVSDDITGLNGTININGHVNFNNSKISGNDINIKGNSSVSLSDGEILQLNNKQLNITDSATLDVSGADLEVISGASLGTNNAHIDHLNFQNASLEGTISIYADADLSGEGAIDRLELSNLTLTGNTVLKLEDLNLLSDMDSGVLNRTLGIIDYENLAASDFSITSSLASSFESSPYISTHNYTYKLELDTNNILSIEKIGANTGIANAIAREETSYMLTGDEDIDIWGNDNTGVILTDMSITSSSSDNIITGINNINGMTISTGTTSITDIGNITGFNNGIVVNDGATLNLTNTKLSGNTTSDVSNAGTVVLTRDSYIENLTGTGSNANLLVSGYSNSLTNVSGNDVTINTNSLLTITDLGILDLAGKTLTIQTGASINDTTTATGELVLNVSDVNMANSTIDTIAVNKLTLDNQVNLTLDTDLFHQCIDQITYEGDNLSLTATTKLNITNINILTDMSEDIDTLKLTPIEGISYSSNIINTTYGRQDVIRGLEYGYIVSIVNVNGDAWLQFNKTGLVEDIDGIAKAIEDGGSDYTLTGDETIRAWGTIGGNIDPLEGNEMNINGNNFALNGGSNTGFIVNADKTLNITDVTELGGFKSDYWLGGTILNDGTTNLQANTADMLLNHSSDMVGSNAIHNNGTLNLDSKNNHSISIMDNITGNGNGTIITNGNANFTSITGNNLSITGNNVQFAELTLENNTLTINGGNSALTVGNGTGNLTINNGTINMANGKLDTITVNNFDGSNESKINLDADLSGTGSIDKIQTNSLTGSLTIDSLNIIKDQDIGRHTINLSLFDILGEGSTIDATKLNIISAQTSNYKYGTSITDGYVTFTKEGMLTGLANAIAKANHSYQLTSDENIDIWGIEASGTYNNGKTLDNIEIIGNGLYSIKGIASLDDNTKIKGINIDEGTSASFTNIKSITGFSSTNGGALNNAGTLTVTSTDISDNLSKGNGGAIFNNGQASLTNVSLKNNTADGTAIVLTASTFGPEDTSIGNGGAIYNTGTMTLNDVSMTGNTAAGLGGAIYNSGMLTLNSSAPATISGNIDSTGSNAIYNTGTVNLNTSNKATLELLDSVTGNNGTINLAGDGSFNINSKITGNTLNLKSGTVNVGTNASFGDTTKLNAEGGIFDIGTNHLSFSEASFGENSTLKLNINSLSSYGQIDADSFNIATNSKLQITVGSSLVSKGETADISLFTSSSSLEDNFAPEYFNNRYNISQVGNGVYHITYSKSGAEIAAEHGGTESVIDAADTWTDQAPMPNNNAKASEIYTDLDSISQQDGREYVNQLNALMPSAAPIVQITELQLAESVWNLSANRIHTKGYNTPSNLDVEAALSNNLDYWLTIGANATKLNTSGSYGDVDMTSYQVATGLDINITKSIYTGIGYAYTKHNIDAYKKDIDAKSNTAMIYGGYDSEKWFVDAAIGYSWSTFNEEKTVTNKTIDADYKAKSLNAKVAVGTKVQVSDNLTIKPQVAVKTAQIKRQAYTDEAGQSVEEQHMNVTTGQIGAAAIYTKDTIEANIAAFYGYDMKSDREEAEVNALNGSSYKVRTDRLGRSALTLDAGINYHPTKNVTVGVGYEGAIRKDYIDNSAKFTVEFKY